MTDTLSPEKLARDWEAFKRRADPSSLISDTYHPVSLKVESCSIGNAAELRAAIAAFAADQGWFTLTDRHVLLDALPADGVVLNGELCKAGQSLHIRHQGENWRVTHYTEGEGGTHTHLACDRRIASRTGEHATLGYRIYYQSTPDRGTLPMVARFAGFTEA